MTDIHTSVKIDGSAAGLKVAAAEAKTKIAEIRAATATATLNSQANVKDFFHELHAGSLAASGSLRGMGMAFSAIGPMMPIVAAGVLFEVLKKFGVFKSMFEGITDALGITSHAFDKETEAIKEQNKDVLLSIQYQYDLAKAQGLTHDAELGYITQIENIKIQQANDEIKRINEEDLRKRTTLLNIANQVAFFFNKQFADATTADEKEIISKRKKSEETIKLIKKQEDIILASQRTISVANAKTNTEDALDDVKSANEAVVGMKEVFSASLKQELAIKKDQKEKEKEVEKNFYAGLSKMAQDSEDSIDKSFEEHAKKVKVAQEKEKEQWRNERGAVMELSNAFDTLFTNGADGWDAMKKQMAGYFEKMISEVLAAIAVWTVLDLLSGGGAAGGKSIGSLFKFIGATLGFSHYASGTNNAPGGLAIVGEHGPELVNIPRGSQVIPNNKLSMDIGFNGVLKGGDIYWSHYRYSSNVLNNCT